MDINVLPVWRKGITGKGVVVSILDDGRSSIIIIILLFIFNGPGKGSPEKTVHAGNCD